MNQRRLRENVSAVVAIAAVAVGAAFAVLLPAAPVHAGFGGWGGIGTGSGAFLPLAGGTLSGKLFVVDGAQGAPAIGFASEPGLGIWRIASGRLGLGGGTRTDVDINDSAQTVSLRDQLILIGVSSDITTNTNEDLDLAPNGTGAVALTKHLKASGAQAVTGAGGTCTTPALAGTDDNFTASAASCGAGGTITGSFGATWGAAPKCGATPNDTNAAGGVAFVATTTTTFTVTSKNAAGAAAGWTVHCME